MTTVACGRAPVASADCIPEWNPDAAPPPLPCEDGEYFQEMVAKAAEQMMSAARSFLRSAAILKSDGAVTSLAEMRIALIRCSAANKVWAQHLAEHQCNETAPASIAASYAK